MSTSLLTPNDAYFKARRTLVVASGALLLALYVGIVPESKEGAVAIFGLHVGSPDSIPFALSIVVLYCIWSYCASYVVQSAEVQGSIVNKIDFFITLAVAVLAIGSYVWVVRGNQRATFGSLFIAILVLVGSIIFLFVASTLAWHSLRRLARKKNLKLSEILVGPTWILVFNPRVGNGSKEITFESDGQIGLGKNDNEARWRIQEGFLELLNSNGAVFSRFSYDKDVGRFFHTNDPDTLSLRDQVIKPSGAL